MRDLKTESCHIDSSCIHLTTFVILVCKSTAQYLSVFTVEILLRTCWCVYMSVHMCVQSVEHGARAEGERKGQNVVSVADDCAKHCRG